MPAFRQQILVEVNIGNEASKSGVAGERELWELLDQATERTTSSCAA